MPTKSFGAAADWSGRLKRVLIESLKSWIDHRSASKGAALAFYTLFSVTPILVLAIVVAGHFFGAEAARGEIVAQVRALVGPNGAQAVQTLLAVAPDPDSGGIATLVAGALLLIAATTVFAELKGSLDELWGTRVPARSVIGMLLRTRLLAFAMVLLLAFLLLASLTIGATLTVIERHVDVVLDASIGPLATASALVSFGVLASLFALMQKTLPDAPPPWRVAWIGAIFTATLFSLGNYLIGLYLGNSNATSGFGAAGSLIALLLWVYYSALIFFLGAEFTWQYAREFDGTPPTPRANDANGTA